MLQDTIELDYEDPIRALSNSRLTHSIQRSNSFSDAQQYTSIALNNVIIQQLKIVQFTNVFVLTIKFFVIKRSYLSMHIISQLSHWDVIMLNRFGKFSKLKALSNNNLLITGTRKDHDSNDYM